MKSYYSIGEMAAVSSITVQRLRHYSKLGLIEPSWVDPNTHYRYYTADQIQPLEVIQQLQYVGLSLAEIKALFASSDESAFAARLEDCQARIREKEQKLKRKKHILDNMQKPFQSAATVGQQAHTGFHLLAAEPAKDPALLTSFPRQVPQRMELRQLLRTHKLSDSYLSYFGISVTKNSGSTQYICFLELSFPAPCLPLPWVSYEGLHEKLIPAAQLDQFLEQAPLSAFFMPLMTIHPESQYFRIMTYKEPVKQVLP